jgi:5'-3' exonuclease
MGIPSYYRTLIQRLPHAIQRKAPSGAAAVKTLVVDMNCMIYHVLKEPKMESTPYPGEVGRLGWERKLQAEVCSYLTHIWKEAGAPTQTYVALDGVVPYAKIKQQRFRRFKGGAGAWGGADCAPIGGAWGGGATQSIGGAWGVGATQPIWDKNAITPGTQFMEAMGDSLRETGKKHGWIISDTNDPGEGEHKVLQWLLKTQLNPGSIVVYGLDADLILLCLIAGDKLGAQYPIFLLREAMAFGKLVRQDQGEVDLCFFQISTLRESLEGHKKSWTKEQFYDYVFGMSFCGNDFLPTGLSLRIRDDGHSILLAGLNELWSKGLNLVRIDGDILRPNAQGLKAFAYWISRQEERLILTTIRRKMTARLGEDEADNLPLREQAEKPMIEVRGDQVYLKKGWKSEYCKLAIGEDSLEQRKTRVTDFWRGWCWILDYYQGRRVDLEWVYPAGYPPTWSDLVEHFELPVDGLEQALEQVQVPLKPQEQLALVLPMSSWGLMLNTRFRDLPTKLPQYWPQGFALESFAKRFGWECEPMIPMLSPARLRHEYRAAP